MKRCFVIMPYGSDDTGLQRLFTGVYQTIIAPAVRNAGYEPKRSDLAAEPGNVTHDIIRDLLESDRVQIQHGRELIAALERFAA